MSAAIEARGLRKSYGEVEAVRGVDLRVEEGEVFALLGPNGAGKTTVVEILEGFRRRDAGEVSVLGLDPGEGARRLKERVGVVLQSTAVEPYLTVRETVELHAAAYPHPRPVDEVIATVGLEEKRDARVTRLSGGQRRRLDVAVALAGDPRVLFLDEPTTGFDPAARRGAWEMVRSLQSRGRTVFLTTHYLDEAAALADRVAILRGGVIVATGPPGSLGAERAAAIVRFRLPPGEALPPDVAAEPRHDGSVEVRTEDPTATLHVLTGWALGRGVRLEELEVGRASLEDVYLDLTGEGAGGDAGA